MPVTLEVSKLSGWLNADAPCRVETLVCDVGIKRCGPRGVRALGGGDAIGVHGEGPTQGCGGDKARAERTKNMLPMLVTLEVSQLEMSALKFFKL